MKNAIIGAMKMAAKTQRLEKLYEETVDPTIFTDDWNPEKDPTGLFFDLDEKRFIFVDYVTNHSGWKDTFLSQNNAVFLAFVSGNDAIVRELEDYVADYEHYIAENEAYS